MEYEKILIMNACIVLKDKVVRGDLCIEDGIISAIAEGGFPRGFLKYGVELIDDNEGKIDMLQYLQGRISEFPVNIETAAYAASKGLHVCVGAPNLIRSGSHSNNMKAVDAVTAGAADIICSDYLPSCMLPAAMLLTNKGLSLPEAIAMVTANPAKAAGINGERGSIEVGKAADLIIFEMDQGHPFIKMTMTAGQIVYKSDYIKCKSREVQEALC